MAIKGYLKFERVVFVLKIYFRFHLLQLRRYDDGLAKHGKNVLLVITAPILAHLIAFLINNVR